MKPIEFEKKYKCYAYVGHPVYKGKEIKQDIKMILLEDNGFAYKDKEGLIHIEKGSSSFTKRSIELFETRFIKGDGKFLPLSDNQEYYLEFVGINEDILMAKRKRN